MWGGKDIEDREGRRKEERGGGRGGEAEKGQKNLNSDSR